MRNVEETNGVEFCSYGAEEARHGSGCILMQGHDGPHYVVSGDDPDD